MKKIFWYLFLGIISIFIFLLIWYAVSNLPSRSVTWEATTTADLDSFASIGDFFKNLFKSEKMSVLIFGRPGADYNGGDLADTIILVHFNPEKNKAFLISIPRDLWIADEDEQFKINEAIYKNKIPSVVKKVGSITGINPDGYIIVDLKTVKEAIDYLGGVDIVLDEPAVDWVSGFTLDKGEHHLDGEYAVWLIRNRYNKEGDFFREKNQQQIIENAFQKFKNLSGDDKLSFITKFVFNSKILQNASLDMSKITSYIFDGNLGSISLEKIVLDFSTKLIKTDSIKIPGATTTISALIPTAGFENYTAIREYIQSKITND